ncbi:RAD50-interacting protein 1 [Blomia tropicalis]|nr:RAD50-interacting protein 1 [Blomia tropicalis]
MALNQLSRLCLTEDVPIRFIRQSKQSTEQQDELLSNSLNIFSKLKSSFLPAEQLTEYDLALQRIAKHREQLVKQLVKTESESCDNKHWEEFATRFEETINDSKDSIKHAKKVSFLYENLRKINEKLLSKLVAKEQYCQLLKLLRDVSDADRSLKSIYPVMKQDYSTKLSVDTIILNICTIRRSYYTVVHCFNLLLQANLTKTSPIYRYVEKLTIDWKGNINQLANDMFTWSFEMIGWPTVGLEDVNPDRSKHRSLFCDLFRILIEMQTGIFQLDDSTKIKSSKLSQLELFANGPVDSIRYHNPIKLMAIPLIKRFNYHFTAPNSKLNNIENPEWFLCQVEQWITRNEPFLSDTIDPILEQYFEDGMYKTAKFQLTCHLLELVKAKLQTDAHKLTNDRLFTLTLDEVIIFNKQIDFIVSGIFEFDAKLNPIRVFFDDEVHFERFINLEKARLNEFVDSIFNSDSSWNIIYGNDSTEENQYMICEAADKLSLLLQNLIERSQYIPSNMYRSRMMDLIVELMDDFRLRLAQVIHVYEEWPFSNKFYAILNTFAFLVSLINEWRNNSYLLQIFNENGDHSSAFNNMIDTFELMIERIFERIENNIITEVTFDIIEYKKLNWHSMSLESNLNYQSEGQQSSMVMSKIGAALIYNISLKFSEIKKRISSNLFNTFLYDIAQKIQDLFFDRIIMEHFFNKDGAKQLRIDIVYGLFSIFSLYIKNTEYTFAKLSDAILLLNCSSETCRNLKDRFQSQCGEIEFKMALRNIGIYTLKPSTVIAVIEKRIGFN